MPRPKRLTEGKKKAETRPDGPRDPHLGSKGRSITHSFQVQRPNNSSSSGGVKGIISSMAAAASPSPSPAPAPRAAAGRPHPTYTKMVTHALSELGGSSARPAIAEYILGRYSGLPARHDDLLSAHLRRLVAEGVLRTNGADSPFSYIFDPPPPSEEKRRPGSGRPRKDSDASTPLHLHVPVPVVEGEKRGRGRPRKNPQDKAAPSVLPAKRKPPGVDDPSVTKRGPATQEAAPIQATTKAQPIRDAVGGEVARVFQNGVQFGGMGIKRGRGRPRKEKPPEAAAAAMSPQLGNAASSAGIESLRKEKPSEEAQPPTAGSVAALTMMGVKRGRGRPRKEKPSEAAAAISPTAGSVAMVSRGFKRGCGRPSMQKPSAAPHENGVSVFMTGVGTPRMDKPAAAISAETSMEELAAVAAAMYAETGGDAMALAGIQAGRGQPGIKELAAAAVAAMSAEGIKKRGRPKKEKPAVQAGVKRSRGRPRKDRCITALVEAAAEELFRDMMTEVANTGREEEDKMQTEGGVAPCGRNETRAAAMSAEGGDAASMGNGGTPRMEDLSAAARSGDAMSTGVKRGRGRPRKNPAPAPAMMSAETGDAMSTGIKRSRGRPRKNPATSTAAALSAAEAGDAVSMGIIKRSRGRPRKNPGAAMPAATVVKRGRGRPRKEKPTPAAAEGKRSKDDQASAGDMKEEARIADAEPGSCGFGGGTRWELVDCFNLLRFFL
uniref:Uncharacterized protein n=1 Tax=Avena sativa TaxID=4498 RepID=A0ACD5X9Z1_AVESA